MYNELEQIALTKNLQADGVLECWVENRSEDWYITYKIYADKVTVQESMDESVNHCFKTCETMKEAMNIASEWC